MTTLQENKFNELHLFIDESGNFGSMSKREQKLVGGVLLFGEYSKAVERKIKNSLLAAVKSIDGKYPQSLHFCDNNSQKKFVETLQKQLDVFRKESNTKIYGVFIRHEEDIYANTSNILAEYELDNRYKLLLWSLIEYCVFADDKVNKRLTDDAVIHLHIASKSVPLKNRDEDYINLTRSLGDNVLQNPITGEYYVAKSINEQTIQGMFSVAMKDKWITSKRKLATIDVTPLNYNLDEYSFDPKRSKESTPALYLADILIGLERQRLNGRYNGYVQILPVLESLEYSWQLDVAMRCKACLVDDNFDALISILDEESIDPDDLHNQDIMNRLVKEFKLNPKSFHRLYEKAVKNIDYPQNRNHALQTLKLLDAVYHNANVFDLFSELYSTLITFSAANHAGDIRKAEANWNRYLELEKQISSIGKENRLEKAKDIVLMFRSRRAVNLMDMFDFEAAEKIIIDAKNDEERFRRNNSDDLEFLSTWRLGICYSLAGQACAFQKKQEAANDCFRNALSCFTEPGDLERVWVYLGHLACDFPETSIDLWNEVKEHLPTTIEQDIMLFEKPFVFAVLIKGLLVFGDINEKQEWLDRNNEILKSDLFDASKIHPYGLILQTLAMLNIAVWYETGEKIYAEYADKFFDQAIRSLASGEKLLQFLSNVCWLRRTLFIKEWQPTNENEQYLDLMLQTFVHKASEFGLAIHKLSLEEIMGCIRFNYW
ncbi:MAG: hypothetical protein LBP59_03520 [Planctomycetaceae bacterium]|jgi:hypothetical protein|nr:hypothetical protein [Planctomycetaceae bacterium]